MGLKPPGMCCECGKPECGIGPFTRPCGSGRGPYGGPDRLRRYREPIAFSGPPIGYRVRSYVPVPMSYEAEDYTRAIDVRPQVWELVDREYRAERMETVELWRNYETRQVYTRPVEDWRPWTPPVFESEPVYRDYVPPPAPEPAPAPPAPAPEPKTAPLSEADTAALEAALEAMHRAEVPA